MRRVRVRFADGHRETLDINLTDPLAIMDTAPLVAAHGPVVASTLGPREERESDLGRHRSRLERSVAA